MKSIWITGAPQGVNATFPLAIYAGPNAMPAIINLPAVAAGAEIAVGT